MRFKGMSFAGNLWTGKPDAEGVKYNSPGLPCFLATLGKRTPGISNPEWFQQ
jgi:hypothetical protein